MAAPGRPPDKGTAPDTCSYATDDRSALLTLNPTTHSYDDELAAARSLVRDPSSAGNCEVRVTGATDLMQAAFAERGYAVRQQQNITTYVVLRSGSHTRVLTLAEARRAEGRGPARTAGPKDHPETPR